MQHLLISGPGARQACGAALPEWVPRANAGRQTIFQRHLFKWNKMDETEQLWHLSCWILRPWRCSHAGRGKAEKTGVLLGKMTQNYMVTCSIFLKRLCKKLKLFAELEMKKQHKFLKSNNPGCVPHCRMGCSWAVNLKDFIVILLHRFSPNLTLT